MISWEVLKKELPGTPSVQVAAFLVMFGTFVDVVVTYINENNDPNGYWRGDTPIGYYFYAFAAILLLRACVVKRKEWEQKSESFSIATVGPGEGVRVSSAAKIPPWRRLTLPLLPATPSRHLPGLASVTAAVFLLLVFIMAYFTLPTEKRGIWIYLIGSRIHVNNPSVIYDPLIVRVKVGERGEAAIYFEGQSVTRQQLVERLNAKFKERGDRIVYVEGENTLNVYDVVNVMDDITGLHAEVVMVTPGNAKPLHEQLKGRSLR